MIRKSLLILIFILFSCSTEGEHETQADQKASLSDLVKIEVPLLDAKGFRSLIEKHNGKVLFINTWATWCVPCKEEFPDLVRLQDHFKNSDVVFIGISVDLPDDVDSKIKPFLTSQKVNFQNYVQNFKEPADLINLLNENWRGAVPATFIYDKRGNQQAFLLGKHTFDEFKAKIESIRKMK
jgi:thiol-disulfide isomerase/thioredoxin